MDGPVLKSTTLLYIVLPACHLLRKYLTQVYSYINIHSYLFSNAMVDKDSYCTVINLNNLATLDGHESYYELQQVSHK